MTRRILLLNVAFVTLVSASTLSAQNRPAAARITPKGLDAKYYMGRQSTWGRQQAEDYTAHRYHQPSDEYRPDLDLSGAAQLADIVYRRGTTIGTADTVPTWNAGAEFNARRDASRKGL
jgi:Ni/Co efflux regulator RcnB